MKKMKITIKTSNPKRPPLLVLTATAASKYVLELVVFNKVKSYVTFHHSLPLFIRNAINNPMKNIMINASHTKLFKVSP